VVYRFDDFTLDSGTRRLLSDEQELHLSPKAFDLLITLIENRDRAISKAELQQKLWPSTYVLETNLAGLIAEIRHALDERSKGAARRATRTGACSRTAPASPERTPRTRDGA
jgi:DNA-binding winged helix-turn-helix (wHTH) protein